jgi:ABC-type multidrug transport system fused ATPase/permease subunit
VTAAATANLTRTRLLGLFRPHITAMSTAIMLMAAGTVLALLQPMLAGRLVDRIAHSSPVATAVALLATMLVGQLLVETYGHYQLERIGELIVYRLRGEFTSHVVRLPVAQLDHYRTGDLLARGTSDASVLREMPRSMADIIFSGFTFIGAVVFMLAIDPLPVAVVLVVIAVAFAAGSRVLPRIQHAGMWRQQALADYTAGLDRTLSAARTVKLFGAEDREIASISVNACGAYRAGLRIARLSAIGNPIVRLAITGSFLAILVIGGSRVADGSLPISQFVALFTYALYSVFPLSTLFNGLVGVRTAAGAYEHLLAILHQGAERDPTPISIPIIEADSSLPLPTPNTGAPLVEFDRVSFRYENELVLNEVSFTLGTNQVTALIGPSGAGKSTILALLCHFHDPTSGTLRWQGHDYASLPLRYLRAQLGLLEQDAPVLHGTIRGNLLIANPDADDAQLWQVLHQANLAQEVARMPDQLDTAVLDRGRSLSGGQRQRLALARAFLSPSELILMDEPTAHLDRVNEYDVMTNLLHARGERSLLVVAHRLSTVTHADQILILQHGRIEATGTHAQLLDHSPVYRSLIENEFTNHEHSY